MSRIGKLGVARVDSLALDLIGPTPVISENGDDLGDVLVQSRVVRLAIVPCIDGREDLLVFLAKIT